MLLLAGRPEAGRNILTKDDDRNSPVNLPQRGKKPTAMGKVGG